MYIRQLKKAKFEEFRQDLIEKSHQNPYELNYNVKINFDRQEYVLKIQPCNGQRPKIVTLQALKVGRENNVTNYEFVVENGILIHLTELLIKQGIV